MSQASERVLFEEGQPATEAYLVKEGTVSLSGRHLPPIEIEGEDVLVGIVELFLADGVLSPHRLCTAAVNSNAQVSRMEFARVRELALEYEFGITANRFLAAVLERTNDRIRTMLRLMPPQWRGYQDRAMLYYDLVNQFHGLATMSGVVEYLGLVDELRASELYATGARFQQERSVSCIAFGSGWMNSAQRFSSEQAICRAGDSADCMYILLEGSVHVAKPNQILATITQPGECFGELAFFLRGKRTADLVAMAGTALLRLDTSSLQGFHATHPDMFIHIAQTLAKRIQANMQTLERHHATQPEQAAAEAKGLCENAQKTLDTFLEKLRRFLRIASNIEISELIAHAQDELIKIE